MAAVPGAIICISSHVARGSVGNRAMVFALERLGFEVWAVPTVLFTHHPGHGKTVQIAYDDSRFVELLETLIQDGRAAQVAGIVSGYLTSTAQVEAVATLVGALKAARPDALYLCDPVMGDAAPGDAGKLYLDAAIAGAIRDLLLPLADIATPNAFECTWLAGAEHSPSPDLAALARSLPPPAVLVTSAPALIRGHIGNLLVTEREPILFEHPAIPNAAKGTGDLLAALLLARRLQGQSLPKAAELALASVFEVVTGTAKAGADELMIAALQGAIETPRAQIVARRLGGAVPR